MILPEIFKHNQTGMPQTDKQIKGLRQSDRLDRQTDRRTDGQSDRQGQRGWGCMNSVVIWYLRQCFMKFAQQEVKI